MAAAEPRRDLDDARPVRAQDAPGRTTARPRSRAPRPPGRRSRPRRTGRARADRRAGWATPGASGKCTRSVTAATIARPSAVKPFTVTSGPGTNASKRTRPLRDSGRRPPRPRLVEAGRVGEDRHRPLPLAVGRLDDARVRGRPVGRPCRLRHAGGVERPPLGDLVGRHAGHVGADRVGQAEVARDRGGHPHGPVGARGDHARRRPRPRPARRPCPRSTRGRRRRPGRSRRRASARRGACAASIAWRCAGPPPSTTSVGASVTRRSEPSPPWP